ncbi:MAG: hypothetical protein JWP12_2479 [Bacteroidetes bacterium]|nr:hypothetical protein [Bacteroidota bacterium]
MHPIQYKGKDFKRIQDKLISIIYKKLVLNGYVRNVYLAANPPNLPASIAFEFTDESKEILIANKIEIPKSLTPFDIEEIKEN